MYDSVRVRSIERGGNLNGDRDGLFQRQRSLERRAIHVLHDQIVGADVVESADVGMVQCRHGTSFPVETFGELLFGNLDSDGAVQSRVTGFKTSPIPPAPRGATIS